MTPTTAKTNKISEPNNGRLLLEDLKNPEAFSNMVAEDEAMASVFHQVERVAPTDYSVVISGESGTGKEMLSRIIHNLSDRSGGPFYAVNVSAFSKELFEDAFFGHAKGAYTGATYRRKGFFEAAQGGTLLLDEITELEQSLQGKLLRVLQESEIYRLGSTKLERINTRVMATTNRDINREIEKKRFRADLFYRLNMCRIHIPPLRRRKEDILPLAYHFLKVHGSRNGKDISSLSEDVAKCLVRYPFPGNVRELGNIIASSVLHEDSEILTLPSVRPMLSSATHGHWYSQGLISLSELEKRHIRDVLEAVDGNRTHAAKILGIGLRTLQRKISEEVIGYYPQPTNS